MSEKPMSKRCRHAGTWIMADGSIEWCYVCGAVREMARLNYGGMAINASRAATTWVSPTGDKQNNPFARMRKLTREGER